ncbi:MAG TPA: transcription elongation factor GreA [Candidatus Aminicenantes bacterium]|nr:transcription elongation factor GreA [Candidatus Aminicenantes bacterium]
MTESIEQKKKAIQQEIEKLHEEYQVELPKRIAEARGQGDLSENAEYHAARERQGFVRARIAQLTRYLGQISEVAAAPVDEKKIGLGSVVVLLERNSNTRCEYTLVHPVEADPVEGRISIHSPVASALLDRTAGEEVVVMVPAGEQRLFIEKVTTLHGHVTTA